MRVARTTLMAISAGLALLLSGCGQADKAPASIDASSISASQQQMINCTAYYQLSSATITKMGVQRMAPVAERLAASADALQLRLGEALGAKRSSELLNQAKQQMLTSLPNPNQLGPLMQQYKEPCQQLMIQG